MRNSSKECLNFIAKHEGFRKNIYMCPGGYETIGYGHLITKQNRDSFLNGVTEKEAIIILEKDIKKAEYDVLKFINVPLSDNQFDALVSFTFNLGGGALQRSGLRRKVNREEHDLVPNEFNKWVFSGGVKLLGLVKRRAEEAKMYQS